MKHLSVLFKPASSLCNMRCAYCFYADVSSLREVKSYGIMSGETASAMLDNIFLDVNPGDTVSLAFQGGEPTLAGLAFFQNFVAYAKEKNKTAKANLQLALQTNGLLLNEDWCRFLKANRFLVGLSVDGSAALHNQNRLDAGGKGTYAAVMEAKRLMDKHGVEYNILCVLTSQLARHPQKVWRFLIEENIRFVQFIPCLDELESEAASPWALTPQRFATFFSTLLPLWKKELDAGNYISVKLFDDIVNLLAAGIVTACGMTGQCQPQYVVEADGSVYPCDFYVLDEARLGYLTQSTLRELFDTPAMKKHLAGRAAPPAPCAACPYAKLCGGGCKRMERAMYIGKNGACGYRAFLDAGLPQLQQVAATVRRQRGL